MPSWAFLFPLIVPLLIIVFDLRKLDLLSSQHPLYDVYDIISTLATIQLAPPQAATNVPINYWACSDFWFIFAHRKGWCSYSR